MAKHIAIPPPIVPDPIIPAFFMSMFVSTILAFYHVGVEQKYWLGPNSCTNSSIEGLTTDQLIVQIMSAPLVRCDEIAWELIGISMAGWNALISAGV